MFMKRILPSLKIANEQLGRVALISRKRYKAVQNLYLFIGLFTNFSCDELVAMIAKPPASQETVVWIAFVSKQTVQIIF